MSGPATPSEERLARGDRPSPIVVLVRNALAGGGRHVLSAAVALWIVPFTLRELGDERFGVWAIAGAVLATLRLLDLGLDRSLTRAVARAVGAGDAGTAAAEVSAGRALLLLSAGFAAAGVWLGRHQLVAFVFAVPPELRAEAAWAIGLTALVAWVELTWMPWRAALDGLGRMDLSHAVETAQRLLSAAGVWVVLSMGGGLRALALKNVITALLAGWAVHQLLRRQAPSLSRLRPRMDRGALAGLLRHGRWVQAGHLAALVVEPAHKVLLANGPGMVAVAAYELGLRLASQLSGLLIAVGQAIYPAAAEATGPDAPPSDDRNDVPRLLPLYEHATRYLAWLAWPAAALGVAIAPAFASAWLAHASQGQLVDDAGWSMSVLTAGWMLTVLAMPAFLLLQAADARGARDGLFAVLAHVLTALAGALWLVRPFGFAGIVVAAAHGPVAGALAAWQRYGSRSGAGAAVLAPVLQPRVLLAAAAAGALAWVVAGRLSAWTAVLGASLAGGALYLVALVLLRVVRPADRAVARTVLTHLRAGRSQASAEGTL